MKAISSAIFSMSEQQAVFEQENSCREARPWQEKRGTSDRRYGIPGVTGLPGHTSFGDRYKPPAWRKKAGGFLRLRISELVRR